VFLPGYNYFMLITDDAKETRSFTAFDQGKTIAAGPLRDVVITSKKHLEEVASDMVLIFDDRTGEQIDVDLRGPLARIMKHLPDLDAHRANAASPPRPGRPKLGVVSREVTLLPRHWEWLGGQPGGASVTIRKLVEEAIRTTGPKDQIRRARESCYRFIMAAAGDRPGFEEAARALFAGDLIRFEKATVTWPGDMQKYARKLSGAGLSKVTRS
jgi:hypothetical protein